MEKVLKTTSVSASWASAWTEELRIMRHQKKQAPLMMMVEDMMAIAEGPRVMIVWFGEARCWSACRPTWRKEVIMMMEKTRTPTGSRRERPTG